MKKVVLKSLRLINFRGAKERKIEFGEKETFISGANGTGKSTIYDAFLWLLFGKDAQNRCDFEIKRIEDGKTLRRTDAVVIGTLDVDGEEVVLKRALVEEWVKPRGATEAVFKSNKTNCFFNDVPIKVTEYQVRVNNIVDDTVFKLITNPDYFPNMKWQEQREQLFQLAGTISDREIAASRPEYLELLDRISGKSLSDYRKELNAKKRKLKDELEQIQPRIDQTRKLMPEKKDFKEYEAQLALIDEDIAKVDKAISDKVEAENRLLEQSRKRMQKINELKGERQSLVFKIQSELKESEYKGNTERRDIELKIKITENESKTLQKSVQSAQKNIDDGKALVEKTMKDVEDLRRLWHDENEKTYDGDDTCRLCGQPLPISMRVNALQMFRDEKDRKLSDITEKGVIANEKVKELEKNIKNDEMRLEDIVDEAMKKEALLSELKETLSNMPMPEKAPDAKTHIESNERYIALSEEIATLENAVTERVPDNSILQEQKKELVKKRDDVKSILSDKDIIAKCEKEIEELEEKGRDVAQQIANVERDEDISSGFTKAKIEECEKRVNSLFSFVTFKLFDYTNEGNEYETCVPLINGIPYPVANTAGQVNAGLDIINALTRFNNVCAPIFIDGRERVNEIIDTESQIINLSVSKDKELVII